METFPISDTDVVKIMEDSLTSQSYPWYEIEKGVKRLVDPLEWSQLRIQKEHWDSHGTLATDDPVVLRRHLVTLRVLRGIQDSLAQSACCRSLEDIRAGEQLGNSLSEDCRHDSDESEYESDVSDVADDYVYGSIDWGSDWGSDGWESDQWRYEEDDEECGTYWLSEGSE